MGKKISDQEGHTVVEQEVEKLMLIEELEPIKETKENHREIDSTVVPNAIAIP